MKISLSIPLCLLLSFNAALAETVPREQHSNGHSKVRESEKQTDSDEAQIRALLERQAADWNRGDVESFVQGYWKSDQTIFVGAGGVKRGWQSILDRYKKDYPDRSAMGQLSFSNLEIHLAGSESAYVLGEFTLDRETGAENKKDAKSGYFTLYFRKLDGRWVIVADHTTAKAPPNTVSVSSASTTTTTTHLPTSELPTSQPILSSTDVSTSTSTSATTTSPPLPPDIASSPPKPDSAKFAELSDRFMKDALALTPTAASQAGYHKHVDAATGKTIELDRVLDDMSLEAMARQRQFYADWKKRFHNETPLASLNPEDAADWQLIDDQIALQFLEFDEIKNYRHNPTVAVELIGNSIFGLLTEDYAPKEVRLGHVLARMRQIPRLLNQVEKYLDNVDPIYTRTAIEENEGNIDLIANTVAREIPLNSSHRAEYDKLAPETIKALRGFSRWLKTDLAVRPAHRSWRLGKALYDKKFKLVMEVGVTPEQLLSQAESELNAVRADMLRLALPLHREMYPGKGEDSTLPPAERENLIIGEVLRKISDNHPRRDRLIPAVEADLHSITKFIKDHKIVSLGSRDNLKVVPTPLFERGILSVAAFHNAPPLNPKAEAEYWVTPIESSVPEKTAESKLREYNNFTLKWLTIHEALPGHYVQFEHLNDIQPERRRLLRSLFENGAYVEGWAEYVAQVMMDEGFMQDDPRFRVVMRKIRLRVLSNAILDIKMHTMGMTDFQAMNLMTRQAFQTQAEAEGKLKRAKLSSTQLPTYYVGVTQWLAFRKNYQERLGKDFDLMKFHNLALDEGPLPVPVVEQLLLDKR